MELHHAINPNPRPAFTGASYLSPGAPLLSPGAPLLSPGAPLLSPGGPPLSPGTPLRSPGGPPLSPGTPLRSPGAPLLTPQRRAVRGLHGFSRGLSHGSPRGSRSSPRSPLGSIQVSYGSAQGLPDSTHSFPGYVQASPGYVQASPGYVQASPGYVQASPGYAQASPGSIDVASSQSYALPPTSGLVSSSIANRRPSAFHDLQKKVKGIGWNPPAFKKPRSKKYTRGQIVAIERLMPERLNDLLYCARLNDRNAALVLPTDDLPSIPLVKNSFTFKQKHAFVEIYEYLKSRESEITNGVSYATFGDRIGYDISKSSIHRWCTSERKKIFSEVLINPDACHLTIEKNKELEDVLVRWLEDQRHRGNFVGRANIQDAAKAIFTVLADENYHSDESANNTDPSFSVHWFNQFKKRNNITFVKLRGEAGSVDLEKIEPEMKAIRARCAMYSPDNIYNCDETGFYLKLLDPKSYATARDIMAGVKADKSCRVTILFCINASGSSLLRAQSIKALQPLVIGKNTARGVDKNSMDYINAKKSAKGWMTSEIFTEWMTDFDDQLTEPTLLLLDSAPQHTHCEYRDPDTKQPWKHLEVIRLPVNSTSVTQPLDAGVISVFKRAYLEILGRETSVVRTLTDAKAITNGAAWDIIPFAWNAMKASTLRHCFAKTKVLPEKICAEIKSMPESTVERVRHERNTARFRLVDQEKLYFEYLVASTSKELGWEIKDAGNSDIPSSLLEEGSLSDLPRHNPSTVSDEADESVVDDQVDSNHSSPITKELVDYAIGEISKKKTTIHSNNPFLE